MHTGSDCRSLAISTDGTALYVVNYLSNTVTELAASNLKILQVVPDRHQSRGRDVRRDDGTRLGRGLHRRDTGLQYQAVMVWSLAVRLPGG